MKWLAPFLLCCSWSTQADMLQALQAYEKKDYQTAQTKFAELLIFGNDLASFNLAAMAINGQGQAKDKQKALSYMMLAAELKHPQAPAIVEQWSATMAAADIEAAQQQLQQLKQQVVIKSKHNDEEETAKTIANPEPFKREPPKFPPEAARKGYSGYVTVRFLVNGQGEVVVADSLDAFPEKVFDKSAIAAIKTWRYQPDGKSHIHRVQLEFSLDGGVNINKLNALNEEYRLWDGAQAGSPQHQWILGTLLKMSAVQSGKQFDFQAGLPFGDKLALEVFKGSGKRSKVSADFEGFYGYATVSVDAQGLITQVHTFEPDTNNKITDLVGQKLTGEVNAGRYTLYHRSPLQAQKINVTQLHPAPESMSSTYWWAEAAKNGNPNAQKLMAVYHQDWLQFMLQRQDAEIMAWAGADLILAGKKQQGVQLLDQAIAKNYPLARELKQNLL